MSYFFDEIRKYIENLSDENNVQCEEASDYNLSDNQSGIDFSRKQFLHFHLTECEPCAGGCLWRHFFYSHHVTIHQTRRHIILDDHKQVTSLDPTVGIAKLYTDHIRQLATGLIAATDANGTV